MKFDKATYEEGLNKDHAVMALPHPLRCPAADAMAVDILERALAPQAWAHLKKLCNDSTLMTSRVIAEVMTSPGFTLLQRMWGQASQQVGGSEMGNVSSHMLMVRHVVAPQPFFRIDDGLCEMLLNTDLDDDIPVELLKAPYSRFYVEFGTLRNLPLYVPNVLTGNHILEGAYVEWGERDAQEGPALYVMLTGSPLGKEHALDDSVNAIHLLMQDGQSLKESLRASFERSQRLSASTGLIQSDEASVDPTLACLNFLAKVLLYLSLPEARKSVHRDKSDWTRATAALKSTAKVQKAARKGKLLTDYILIEAPPFAEEGQRPAGEGSPARTVKAHWRRGHYRMQAHGPQLALRRLTFIRPTLVHGDAGLSESPEYRVR